MKSVIWIAILAAGCGSSSSEGSGNGSGGSGGASGGSSFDGGGGSPATAGAAGSPGGPEAWIATLCASFAALPCGKSEAQCIEDATGGIGEAAQKGCSSEYEALLECAADSPAGCAPGGGIDLPECQDEVAALDACDPPTIDCVGADVPGISCSKNCQSWGAACSETPQGLECSCTIGAHAGEQFQLSSTCAPGWDVLAQQSCE